MFVNPPLNFRQSLCISTVLLSVPGMSLGVFPNNFVHVELFAKHTSSEPVSRRVTDSARTADVIHGECLFHGTAILSQRSSVWISAVKRAQDKLCRGVCTNASPQLSQFTGFAGKEKKPRPPAQFRLDSSALSTLVIQYAVCSWLTSKAATSSTMV